MVFVTVEFVSRIGRKHFIIKHLDSSGLRSKNSDCFQGLMVLTYVCKNILSCCQWQLYFTVISRLPGQFHQPWKPTAQRIHTPNTNASASKAYLFCHGNPCHFQLQSEWWCHYQERPECRLRTQSELQDQRIMAQSQTITIQREAISTRHLGFTQEHTDFDKERIGFANLTVRVIAMRVWF